MNKLIKAAKRWKIPVETAEAVIQRDTCCVYCGCEFDNSVRSRKASWEHIINDIRLCEPDNIALCCVGCNASKGVKELDVWLETKKAQERGARYPEFLVNKGE